MAILPTCLLPTTQRIVTCQRGSWRWQNAYRVATYLPRKTRDGRWLWSSAYHGPKRSEPQLRGHSAYVHGIGSAHNQPVDDAAALDALEAVCVRIERMDGGFLLAAVQETADNLPILCDWLRDKGQDAMADLLGGL